jgi:hypothetical protein
MAILHDTGGCIADMESEIQGGIGSNGDPTLSGGDSTDRGEHRV